MAAVLISCPTTGGLVPVGVQASELDELEAENMMVDCPECGSEHLLGGERRGAGRTIEQMRTRLFLILLVVQVPGSLRGAIAVCVRSRGSAEDRSRSLRRRSGAGRRPSIAKSSVTGRTCPFWKVGLANMVDASDLDTHDMSREQAGYYEARAGAPPGSRLLRFGPPRVVPEVGLGPARLRSSVFETDASADSKSHSGQRLTIQEPAPHERPSDLQEVGPNGQPVTANDARGWYATCPSSVASGRNRQRTGSSSRARRDGGRRFLRRRTEPRTSRAPRVR